MKETLLKNYDFLLVKEKSKKAILVENEEHIKIMLEDGRIADGDLVIKLTPDILRVASEVRRVELL